MKIVKYLIMSFFTLSIISYVEAVSDNDPSSPLERKDQSTQTPLSEQGLMLTVDVSCDPSEPPAIINVRLNDSDTRFSDAGYFVYLKQKAAEATHTLATLSLAMAITLVVILDPFVEPVCRFMGL